jgi:CheY-like chemotaxis protein
MIEVSVRDTGLGIPPEDQLHIFDEFRQSERTAARGFGGMGLGLAISRHLVERHGGTLGVHSTGVEGEGATFVFRLPALLEEDDLLKRKASEENRSVVILSVAEEEAAQITELLHGEGIPAADWLILPDEAWKKKLLEVHPALVLVDQRLVEQLGWEMVRELKTHPTTRNINFIFFRFSSEAQIGSMLEMEYQFKPLATEQLRQLLTNHRCEESPSPMTVLIVDDDAATRDLHKRLVAQEDPACRILTACNGREALEILAHTKPDLVLLDLIMPELDGFDVIEAMRQRQEWLNIPIVVLTGQSLNEQEIDRLNQGVVTVLNKWIFTADETISRIKNALARGTRINSSAQQLVQKAIAYLQQHYAEPVGRKEIAQAVGFSEDYLTFCFQQELGVSPVTYLNRYRIYQARQKLEKENAKITEVALSVGFSDPAYFSRIFHRETSLTPREYRRLAASQ